METPDQLLRSIESLEELRSIVKTMKSLSAVSIRQYESAAAALGEYYRTVELGLRAVLDPARTPPPTVLEPAGPGFGGVVFSSDHGLCGRFNEEITGHTLARIRKRPEPPGQQRFLAIGARGASLLEHEGLAFDRVLWTPGSAAGITTTVRQVLETLEAWQREHGVGHVRLYHNRPESGGGYRPVDVELLPVDPRRLSRSRRERWPSRRLPFHTMERGPLLSALLRQYFFVSLFRACAESLAAEHASRLAAMQSAERNLDERLETVTTRYRRARQDAITSELLDVVAGFEAITSGRR